MVLLDLHRESLMDDDDLEPEILTYREFRNRQTLLAWRRRWRAHELQQNEGSPRAGGRQRRKDPYRGEGSAPSTEA
jgi:hypothetical protein